MKNRFSTKKLIAAVIGVFLLCVVAFVFVFLAESANKFDRVTGLTLQQDGHSIVVGWDDMKCKGYRLTVQSEDGRAGTATADTNHFVIKRIEYNKEYTVRVQGVLRWQELSTGAEETIYTLKPQKITTTTDGVNGFAKERFSLNAEATGEISYSSDKEEVASVDETGEVFLHKPGKAVISVEASETEECQAAVKEIPIAVCPQKLKTITADKEYDGGSVKITWSKVPFAEEYILSRYSPHEDAYVEVGHYKAEKTGVTVAREAGRYAVEARVDVHGTVLSSKTEEDLVVKSSAEKAKSYGSLTVIDTLDGDDLETVTTIRGSGSINNPQSMCCTKDGYVVAFVTKGNGAGLLKKYDRKGELVASRNVGGMHHANGCTYNPYADRIYVCPTYASHKERTLKAYDPSTLEATGSIGLHNAPSGAAYDDTNNRYYMSASWRLYVTDSDFNVVKVIKRLRHNRSQDMGAYNGVALSCIWTGGKSSYIDMYRVSDGAYIGSYSVPLGEIESVCVDDGHLVILINKGTDVIYRTKDRVDL